MINEQRIPSELGDRDGLGPLENWFLAELDSEVDNEQLGRQESWGMESLFFLALLVTDGPWYQGPSRPRS